MDTDKVLASFTILSFFVSLLAVSLTIFALYKNFYQMPSRKIWSGLSIYLLTVTHGKNQLLPLIVIEFSFYNSGAVLAVIQNIQLRLSHKKSESGYTFMPYKQCDDFLEDGKSMWGAMTLIGIPPRTQNHIQKFISFQEKAGDGHFVPIEGEYQLTIEVQWEGKKTFEKLEFSNDFTLTKTEANKWKGQEGIQKITAQLVNQQETT